MNYFDFQGLPEVEDFSELENPVVGTKFLFGRKMINQKHSAEVGMEVSYYQVIAVRKGGKNLEYMVRIERLEKPVARED